MKNQLKNILPKPLSGFLGYSRQRLPRGGHRQPDIQPALAVIFTLSYGNMNHGKLRSAIPTRL